MEVATSISTILLIDIDVGSSSHYIYIPTSWFKHIKTTVKGALVWKIFCVVNYNFVLLSMSPPASLIELESKTVDQSDKPPYLYQAAIFMFSVRQIKRPWLISSCQNVAVFGICMFVSSSSSRSKVLATSTPGTERKLFASQFQQRLHNVLDAFWHAPSSSS